MTNSNDNAVPENESRVNWASFKSSPLALFAGIFSLLESVILIYFVGILDEPKALDALDGAFVVIVTVALFSLIVIGRPQALYPPERWVKTESSEESLLAIKVIAIFMLILAVAWGFNMNGDELVEIFKSS